MAETRRIFNHANSSREVLQELLQNIFTSEILLPSKEVWIVSPWISNIEIFDNRGGAFTSLCPDWQGLTVRLQQILVLLMSVGTNVKIISNLDNHNDRFFQSIEQKCLDTGLNENLILHRKETLHTKGIFTQHGSLTGSMNLTFNGVKILDEHLIYTISRADIAKDILECRQYLAPENCNE